MRKQALRSRMSMEHRAQHSAGADHIHLTGGIENDPVPLADHMRMRHARLDVPLPGRRRA